MVITRLKGGLGNQMFQYACGRALALRNNDSVKIDISGYTSRNGIDTPRLYALGPFNIHADIATPDEVRAFRYRYGIFSKANRFIGEKVFRQFHISFNPKIIHKTGDVYLDGFWQSEKYFLDKQEVIRTDLSLKQSLTSAAQKIADMIDAAPVSISLHVRRGDYVKDRATNLYWGTCSPEYYDTAIKIMIEKVAKTAAAPIFFIFSDDIEWVKTAIAIPYKTVYVSDTSVTTAAGSKTQGATIPDFNELILMSKCSHNITANSSFSWWGAWLNRNPEKIVISPQRWNATDERNYRHITPPSWIRI